MQVYKMLPRSTYTAPDEDKSSVRGVRYGSEGARDAVCDDGCQRTKAAAGDDRPLQGTSVFQAQKTVLQVLQPDQRVADSLVFGLWWKEVLLPSVRSVTSKPVLLIMDNHSSHANLVEPRGQVTVLELSPNCTAKHQPADAGIIAALKKLFRTFCSASAWTR